MDLAKLLDEGRMGGLLVTFQYFVAPEVLAGVWILIVAVDAKVGAMLLQVLYHTGREGKVSITIIIRAGQVTYIVLAGQMDLEVRFSGADIITIGTDVSRVRGLPFLGVVLSDVLISGPGGGEGVGTVITTARPLLMNFHNVLVCFHPGNIVILFNGTVTDSLPRHLGMISFSDIHTSDLNLWDSYQMSFLPLSYPHRQSSMGSGISGSSGFLERPALANDGDRDDDRGRRVRRPHRYVTVLPLCQGPIHAGPPELCLDGILVRTMRKRIISTYGGRRSTV